MYANIFAKIKIQKKMKVRREYGYKNLCNNVFNNMVYSAYYCFLSNSAREKRKDTFYSIYDSCITYKSFLNLESCLITG